MSKDQELIKHLAKLARLELSPQEEAAFAKQIPRILEYIGQLQQVKITDVPAPDEPPTAFRHDQAAPSHQAQDILAGAPEKLDNFWKVHSVF